MTHPMLMNGADPMLDPKTNTSLAGLAQAMSGCESFAITGHVNPDGDCLGSQLALALALRQIGKKADVLLAQDAPIEEGLHFLPGFGELIPACRYDGTPDGFICVDVSVPDRIKDSAAVMARARRVFVLDHHEKPQVEAELTYDDPDAASCSMLVWDLVRELGARYTPEIALCAYTGLMTDTGRFQYQNTDMRAFVAAAQMVSAGASPSLASREFFQNRSVASLKMEQQMISRMRIVNGGEAVLSMVTLDDFAECGAVDADAESLIDTLRSVRGVRVACLLKERDGFVRGSLRAKDDGTDVAALARALGGGGHKAAAGFTLHMPLSQAVSAVEEQLAGLRGESHEAR